MLSKQLTPAVCVLFTAALASGSQASSKASTSLNDSSAVRAISLARNLAPSGLPVDAAEGAGDTAGSAETDARLAEADSHFNRGRQAYFKADYATAHREFDEAVNVLLIAPDSLPDHRRIERRL